MEMPKPTRGHEQLKRLAGRWQGDILGSRMEMSKDGSDWACLFESDYRRG